jgi:predicted NUDIX family phosphoesterase
MSKDEEVLCVRAELLESLGGIRGFVKDVQPFLPSILDRSNQSFQPRSACETDPSYKQLIPYVLLLTGEGSDLRVFQYSRGKGGGESRLHALKSIGIGGHISTEDADGDDWYLTGMHREISEEVTLETDVMPDIVGLIYDDSNEVGRVHLGIVHTVRLDSASASSNEADLMDSSWMPCDEIVQRKSEFETWSQLCIDNLLTETQTS